MNSKVLAAAGATMSVLALVSAAIPSAASEAHTRVAPRHILIYGPSLNTESPINEATIARALGYDVAVADSIAWRALDRSDFARYDEIVIGDRGCADDSQYLDLAAATRNRWTPAVMGNVALLGTDPTYHANAGIVAARTLVENGLNYAAAAGSTGAYIALGCSYTSAGSFTSVPVLAGFGPFTVRGQGTSPLGDCPDDVEVVRPRNPLMQTLDEADLSNWNCSIHAGVDSYPYPFVVVARDDPSNLPYLLTRAASSRGRSDLVTVFHGTDTRSAP